MTTVTDEQYVVPVEMHHTVIAAAFRKRGYTQDEADAAAVFCGKASWYGVKTHAGLKALQVDDIYGAGCRPVPGCVPGARVDKQTGRFKAMKVWDANKKIGHVVAGEAMQTAMQLADEFGIGAVSVNHAFHYLWGGGYVMDAAFAGYIAYTTCTGAIPEVVPHGGKAATMGTNPHTWAFPTQDVVGFPVVMDIATSVISNGTVKQCLREGKPAPPDAILDADGNVTTDPSAFAAHLPFGGHKGSGLCIVTELLAGFGGGSLPTIRCHPERAPDGEETTPNFFFMAIHPDAINPGHYPLGRDQISNVRSVVSDILGHGNEHCRLPGQSRHEAAQRSDAAGGLLFTRAEIDELADHAAQCDVSFPTPEKVCGS